MNTAKAEVLRYLGYKDQVLSPELDAQIHQAMEECRALSRPAQTHKLFGVEELEQGILLTGTNLVLEGDAIRAHLSPAVETAAMAATLGVQLEQAIRRYEYTDLTYALLLDAAATQLIEEVCDQAEAEIAAAAAARGLKTNFRFSPGYGDLPLSVQPILLNLLSAGRTIGLSCTDRCILTPRKSVTAFLGLLPQDAAIPPKRRSCDSCSLAKTCRFKKDGVHCGSAKVD